jgi:outer membrane lipoprotein-sorting protein
LFCKEPKALRRRRQIWIVLLALAPVLASGCAVKTRREVRKEEIRPLMEASKEQLVDAYNQQVRAVRSLQATVDLIPSTGSTYSGVIEQYHDVSGFILAQRPASIRVIGQAPVVAKNIFDMVSDGKIFRIFIPSKNMFLVGATSLLRPSKKPIENLRPQHIVEALFWPEIQEDAKVLFEQFDVDPDRYYILTVLRQNEAGNLEIGRKIWFNRTDLRVSRVQVYGPAGRLDADMSYSDWEPFATPPSGSTAPAASAPFFPRDIRIWRPQDDYRLEVRITKLTLNEEIAADRFELAQPPGTELVQAGEENPNGKQ